MMSDETNEQELSPVTARDLEQLLLQVHQALDAYEQRVEARYSKLEDLIDDNDKKIASLAVGFGESVGVLDALMILLSKFGTEEMKEEFTRIMKQNTKAVLDILRNGSDGLVPSASQDEPTTSDATSEQQADS